MTVDLPESWDDEPWPLEEPDLAVMRPVNWSDTHDNAPQVADLADDAWEYAVDHGVSMERALVELQHREMRPRHLTLNDINDVIRDIYSPMWKEQQAQPSPLFAKILASGTLEVHDKPRQAKMTNVTES